MYSKSSKTKIIKKLCKSKNLSNHRVVMLKNPFSMTTLWFDEIFENRKKLKVVMLKTLYRSPCIAIIKKLWKSKNLSNHRVVMLKNPFSMTTLWFDKIFDNRKKTEKPFVDHSVIWLDFQLFNSNVSKLWYKKR